MCAKAASGCRRPWCYRVTDPHKRYVQLQPEAARRKTDKPPVQLPGLMQHLIKQKRSERLPQVSIDCVHASSWFQLTSCKFGPQAYSRLVNNLAATSSNKQESSRAKLIRRLCRVWSVSGPEFIYRHSDPSFRRSWASVNNRFVLVQS